MWPVEGLPFDLFLIFKHIFGMLLLFVFESLGSI